MILPCCDGGEKKVTSRAYTLDVADTRDLLLALSEPPDLASYPVEDFTQQR